MLFLGLGGSGKKCCFLFVGSTIGYIILQSQEECNPLWLSHRMCGLFLTLLFCHFAPTRQPGTKCNMRVFHSTRSGGHVFLNITYLELDTLKQLPPPPSSVKLGCLTSVMPFEFSGRHSEVLPSYS